MKLFPLVGTVCGLPPPLIQGCAVEEIRRFELMLIVPVDMAFTAGIARLYYKTSEKCMRNIKLSCQQ